jgi:DNA-binding response OmpR family regulator
VTTPLSILVVDDEFDIAELLAELLATQGHRVTTATNGALAQALLATNDYDLVITDLMMPIIGGVELVQGMRASPRHAEIPVILISAQRDVAVIGHGLVQATLQKPFSPRALYAAMERVIADREASIAGAKPPTG